MKKVALLLVSLILCASLIAPTKRAAADGQSQVEGTLEILGYFGDAWREDDRQTVSILESFFYNNTGSERFSGNITLWMQGGARIASMSCGSQLNFVARVDSTGIPACLSLQSVNSTTFKVNPFRTGEFMSFYGERHTLSLNATSLNTSASNQLDFNTTIGPESKASFSQVSLGNVTMNSTVLKPGLQALRDGRLSWGPPRNLTVTQPVNLRNGGGEDETISLNLLNVPEGWSASMTYGGGSVSSMIIPAGQTRQVVLNVSAPSHILQLRVQYTISGIPSSSGVTSPVFERSFPYNTTLAESLVYAFDRDAVSTGGKFEIHSKAWNVSFSRYIYVIIGYDIHAWEVSTVTFNWVPPPFEVPQWAIAALIVIASLLVAYPILRKRRKSEKPEKAVEKAESSQKTAAGPAQPSLRELRERREVLLKILERLAVEEKDGVAPQDIHAEIKQDIGSELATVEQQLQAQRTTQARKKAILKAMRKLEKDFKEGRVEEGVYKSLKARYEKEALNLIRRMEETKGGDSDGQSQ